MVLSLGRVITVLAGLTYYAMYILGADVNNANNGGAHLNVWLLLIEWLTYPIVLFLIEFLIIKKVPALIKDGRVFAIVMLILVAIVTFGLTKFFPGHDGGQCQQQDDVDWRRRRLRRADVAQRLGHHLAREQTNYRCAARRAAGRSDARAPGVYCFAHQCVVVAADAFVHGHFVARLADFQRRKIVECGTIRV